MVAGYAENNWDTRSNRANSATGTTSGSGGTDDEWLRLSRHAYESSTDFVNANLRSLWEDNLRLWSGRHLTGSKYYSADYKARSKLFRPKTRSQIRKSEAAAAAAFFSRQDAVNIGPINDSDEFQLAGAEMMSELVNHRLGVNGASANTVKWFQTLMGAWQSSRIHGCVTSKQYWRYEDRVISEEPVMDQFGQPVFDENGEPAIDEVVEVLHDEPVVRLIAPENLRIDAGADWMDPINSSPFLIELIPMYVVDVKSRMERTDPKTGQPDWKHMEDGQIRAAIRSGNDYNSTRQAREGYRQDAKDASASNRPRDYEIVWVHENIMRKDGKDVVFYTLGCDERLTDPKPLDEVYDHCAEGERPYVMGIGLLEAFKTFPAGIPELTKSLQLETNEVTNTRLDNVKIAMNGRPIVRRGAKVDLNALRRHVPGGIVLAETWRRISTSIARPM